MIAAEPGLHMLSINQDECEVYRVVGWVEFDGEDGDSCSPVVTPALHCFIQTNIWVPGAFTTKAFALRQDKPTDYTTIYFVASDLLEAKNKINELIGQMRSISHLPPIQTLN